MVNDTLLAYMQRALSPQLAQKSVCRATRRLPLRADQVFHLELPERNRVFRLIYISVSGKCGKYVKHQASRQVNRV